MGAHRDDVGHLEAEIAKCFDQLVPVRELLGNVSLAPARTRLLNVGSAGDCDGPLAQPQRDQVAPTPDPVMPS